MTLFKNIKDGSVFFAEPDTVQYDVLFNSKDFETVEVTDAEVNDSDSETVEVTDAEVNDSDSETVEVTDAEVKTKSTRTRNKK